MIISSLQGGTGNNLFQIAASIGAAEWYGSTWYVQGDFGYKAHEQFDPKKYFSIPEDRYAQSYALPRYTEPHFSYYQIPGDNYELMGYFQSEKYFKHCQSEIRKAFAAPPKQAERIKWKYRDVLENNTCAVHVRRGDYLNLAPYHYNLETDYYTDAMAQIKSAMPDVHFVCFSDDIEWCKSNISADTFISDKAPVELHLMSYCRHFIIANSSFSWWGSWLCTNPDKIIIAPPKSKWFGERKKSLNVNDLYCDNWTVNSPKGVTA